MLAHKICLVYSCKIMFETQVILRTDQDPCFAFILLLYIRFILKYTQQFFQLQIKHTHNQFVQHQDDSNKDKEARIDSNSNKMSSNHAREE